MNSTLRYLGLAAAAYLLMLIATLPAAHLYGWFGEQLPEVKLEQPRGSLWSGSARSITVAGYTLIAPRWSFAPSALLGGKIGFDTTAGGDELKVDGRIAVGSSEQVEISDLNIHLNPQQLPLPPMVMGAKPEGEVEIELEQLRLSGNRIEQIAGEIRWQGAALQLVERVVLGDFTGQIKSNDKGIELAINDSASDLKLDLTLTLDRQSNYALQGTVGARNRERRDLQQLLKLIGGGNGSQTPIRFSGRLPPLPVGL